MIESGSTTARLHSLLLRSNDGDGSARQQLIGLVEEHVRELTRRMLRHYPRLHRWEETDDVFQNAIWRLYRALEDVRPDSLRGFFGLATAQVRRTLLDLVRHHFGPLGDARHHDSAEVGSRLLSQATTNNSEPETLADWTRFHEVVETLPSDEQDAFSLVWYGGLSQREAAEVLEISERTMIRRMNRARLLIHAAMSGMEPT